MEFIKPEQNFYKAERPKIETIVENMIDTPEKEQNLYSKFFDLETEELTEEEREDFKLFVRYTAKRVLNAMLHKQGIETKEDADVFLESYDISKMLLFHDLAHSIVTIENNEEEKGASPVSLFLRIKEEYEINNSEIFAEEARALIWVKVVGKKPLSTMLFKEKDQKELVRKITEEYGTKFPDMTRKVSESIQQLDSTSFESYLNTFQDVAYGLVEVTNTRAIEKKHDWETGSGPKVELEKYGKMIEELKANPDPRLVESLRNVFDDREDPKVLYDEFRRICGDLILRLRTREEGDLK